MFERFSEITFALFSFKSWTQERHLKTWRSYFPLKSNGIDSDHLTLELHAFLVKTYVRPTTYYGLEKIYPIQIQINFAKRLLENQFRGALFTAIRITQKSEELVRQTALRETVDRERKYHVWMH